VSGAYDENGDVLTDGSLRSTFASFAFFAPLSDFFAAFLAAFIAALMMAFFSFFLNFGMVFVPPHALCF
jgi:hypothetical protein